MGNRIFSRFLALFMSAAATAGPGVAQTNERPIVRLVTSVGDIDIQLAQALAPRTVDNFLRLVDDGFYNGLIFHRVVAGFVIQAGGYDAELNFRKAPATVMNESNNGLANRVGSVAMARLSDPHSADAQFYINVQNNPSLDAQPGQLGYTVFGQVIAGMETVTGIELSDTRRQNGMAGVPVQPIVIEEAKLLPGGG